MFLLKLFIIFILISASVLLAYKTYFSKEVISNKNRIQSAVFSLIANFADTFGIGSLAVFSFIRGWFTDFMPEDKKFLGSINFHAVVICAVQGLLISHLQSFDEYFVLSSIFFICLGALFSGYLVLIIDTKLVQWISMISFSIILVLLFLQQMGLVTSFINTGITGYKLPFYYCLMFISGCSPAFGVGGYVFTESIVFLFGGKLVTAFVIMMLAGSLQTTFTSAPFVLKGKIYLRQVNFLVIFGVIGVFLAQLLLHYVSKNDYLMNWILFFIVFMNIIFLVHKIFYKK